MSLGAENVEEKKKKETTLVFETSGWASKLVEFVISSSFLAITRCSSSAVSFFSPFGRMMLLQSLLGTSGDLFHHSSSGQVSVNLGWDFGELDVCLPVCSP